MKSIPQNSFPLTGEFVQQGNYGTKIYFFCNGLCEAEFRYDLQDNLTASHFSTKLGSDIYTDKYLYAPNQVCLKTSHFKNDQTIGCVIENHPNGNIKSISPEYKYDPRFSPYDGLADPVHRIKDSIAREFDINGTEIIDKRTFYFRGRPINRMFQTDEQLNLLAEFLETRGYQLQTAVTQDGPGIH